jgi:hypothetical protein
MSEKGNLEQPEEIRDAKDERQDGRPTAAPRTTDDPGPRSTEHPTVAPEEEGGSPTTEHGPGGDL